MTFKLGDRSTRLNADNDARLAVGQGKIPGTTATRLQAIRNTLTDGVEELIWNYSPLVNWPSNLGEALALVSSNGSDAGVIVEVVGLDENFDSKEEIVVCNGVTPVPLSGLWSRVNQATVYGTQACVGNITVSGSNVFAYIVPARQQHMSSQFSVGRSRTFQIPSILPLILKFGGASATNVIFRIYYRESNDGVFKMEFPLGLTNQATSTTEFTETFPVAIPGPADFYITAEADSAGVACAARMQVLLEKTN